MRQDYGGGSGSDVYVLPGEGSADRPRSVASPVVPAGSNDRKSDRQKVPPHRQSCQLKLGDELLPALMLDTSEGGFGLLISGRHDLKLGQKAPLHTDRGWFTIRIVRIAEAVRPKVAAAETSDGGPCFRLGCARVGWGPLPDEPSASTLPTNLWARLTQRLSSSRDG
jgi:hypothetical protein